MPAKIRLVTFSAAVLLLSTLSGAVEFSRPEWDDPGCAGSSLWVRNGRARMVALEAFFVRSNGFQTYGEVALNAGARRYYFTVEGARMGQWARLVPRSPRRIWVRAQDSLVLSRFECGKGLKPGRASKRTAEEFVLDLKVVDNWGDSAVAKLFQIAPRYDIQEKPGMVRTGTAEDRGAAPAWSTLDVTW